MHKPPRPRRPELEESFREIADALEDGWRSVDAISAANDRHVELRETWWRLSQEFVRVAARFVDLAH